MFRRALALILILGVSPYAEAFIAAPAPEIQMASCCAGGTLNKSCSDCPAVPASVPSCCSKVLPAAWLPGVSMATTLPPSAIDYLSSDSSFPTRSEQPSLPPPKSV